MIKIQLKTGRRKTQVSRSKIRSIMTRLFEQRHTTTSKKNSPNKSTRKTVSRKPAIRKAASRKTA